MIFNFEIPTPPACVDCRFHYITSSERYGRWTMACLIDPDIKIAVSSGLDGRSKNCPGRLSKEEL